MKRQIAPFYLHKPLRTRGFSMFEVLAITAIFGAVTGFAIQQWGSAGTKMAVDGFADQLKTGLQIARFEALKRNRNVAFYWDANSATFQTVVKSSTSSGCDIDTGDRVLSPLEIPEIAGLDRQLLIGGTFVSQDGIVWKANGLTASCNNFDVSGSNTIEVRFDGVRRNLDFDVAITPTGRVSTAYVKSGVEGEPDDTEST